MSRKNRGYSPQSISNVWRGFHINECVALKSSEKPHEINCCNFHDRRRKLFVSLASKRWVGIYNSETVIIQSVWIENPRQTLTFESRPSSFILRGSFFRFDWTIWRWWFFVAFDFSLEYASVAYYLAPTLAPENRLSFDKKDESHWTNRCG